MAVALSPPTTTTDSIAHLHLRRRPGGHMHGNCGQARIRGRPGLVLEVRRRWSVVVVVRVVAWLLVVVRRGKRSHDGRRDQRGSDTCERRVHMLGEWWGGEVHVDRRALRLRQWGRWGRVLEMVCGLGWRGQRGWVRGGVQRGCSGLVQVLLLLLGVHLQLVLVLQKLHFQLVLVLLVQ